jgi:Tfp pilus assembly protein PilX
MKKLNSDKGVLLIICLILLVVIAGVGLTVSSISATNNKASTFSGTSAEAQQKADAIANFVFTYLNAQNQVLDDVTPCSPGNTCLVWNGQPGISGGGSMTDTKSNTTAKQWWYANTWAYPNATQLHAFASGTYSGINGSQVTDPIANYAIVQDGSATPDPQGYNVRSLRIIAYSTDKNGQTAAVKQLYYPWVARCKTTPGTPAGPTSTSAFDSGCTCYQACGDSTRNPPYDEATNMCHYSGGDYGMMNPCPYWSGTPNRHLYPRCNGTDYSNWYGSGVAYYYVNCCRDPDSAYWKAATGPTRTCRFGS